MKVYEIEVVRIVRSHERKQIWAPDLESATDHALRRVKADYRSADRDSQDLGETVEYLTNLVAIDDTALSGGRANTGQEKRTP